MFQGPVRATEGLEERCLVSDTQALEMVRMRVLCLWPSLVRTRVFMLLSRFFWTSCCSGLGSCRLGGYEYESA